MSFAAWEPMRSRQAAMAGASSGPQTVRKLAGLGLEVARGATGEGIWAFSASVTI
jgi:hypothetical protein